MPEISLYKGDRKPLVPLLLEGDEDEAMLDRYLYDGEAFVAVCDGSVVAAAIVVGNEVMNISLAPGWRRRGLGSRLLSCIEEHLRGKYGFVVVGTGDLSPARAFYEAMGYEACAVRKDFFMQYRQPVMEEGRRLVDMVLYRKAL